MVTQVLVFISKTCQLVGKPSPVCKAEGEYILPAKRLVEVFRCQDPPYIPQMSVPINFTEAALHLDYLTSNSRAHADGDLITTEFYFLLQSIEYTGPHTVQKYWRMVHATRTKQFRLEDIGFWKESKILSWN